MNNKYFKEIQVPRDINISINKGLNRASNEKKIKRIKKVSIILSLSLMLVSSSVIVNKEISANIKRVFGDIANYFGLSNDVNKYVTSFDNPITRNNFTISINEVLIDRNQLTISSTLKSEEGTLKGHPEVNPTISLNGKLININSNGISEYIDDSTVNMVNTYTLNTPLEDNVKLNINYDNIRLVNDSKIDEVKGSWNFAFTINVDTLKDNTVEIALNEYTEINNDETIRFTKYSSNEVGATIDFTRSTDNSDYAIKLIGKDDLGNSIEFYTDYEQNGVGTLRLDNVMGKIGKEATKLNLFIYTSKTLANDSWVQTGNELKINIKN